MDRDRLEAWLDDGLSLDRIAELAGRHPSKVSYWLKKYGLVANGHHKHAAKGGVDRERLEALVAKGRPIRAIASELGVSAATVRHWIARYDLPQPIEVRRGDVDDLLRRNVAAVIRVCPRHGRGEFAVIASERRLRCKRCRAEVVANRRRRIKKILIHEAGGHCEICGYHLCARALEFHHRDPALKSFGLAKGGVTRSIETARAEASKCVLLCANCHAEVEAGVTALPIQS